MEPLWLTSQLVPLLLFRLHWAGIPTRPLIRKFGLPADTDARPGVRLPLRQLHALQDAVAERLGDDQLGLKLATWLPRGRYGLIEFAARSAVEDPSLTMGQIAERLAYSDVRAFARAFRRWYGAAPGRFRPRG